MWISTNGLYLYVAHSDNHNEANRLVVVNTADGSLVASVDVGFDLQGLAVTPDGEYIYATIGVGYGDNAAVKVIRTSDYSVVDTIAMSFDNIGRCAVTPNGDYLYVTSSDTTKSVTVIKTSDGSIVAPLPLSNGARSLAVDPDGEYVYVTHWDEMKVSVIRITDNTVVDSFLASAQGTTYSDIDIIPDSAYAYVLGDDEKIRAVRLSDNTTVATISVSSATGADITADGDYVFVSAGEDIAVIQTSNNQIAETISSGRSGGGYVVTDPNGAFVYRYSSIEEMIDVYW